MLIDHPPRFIRENSLALNSAKASGVSGFVEALLPDATVRLPHGWAFHPYHEELAV
jgi:hypothetical protein